MHEDCDVVNVFLSSQSQCSCGFPKQMSRCAFLWSKVEFTRFIHSFGGPNASRFLQSVVCRGAKYENLMHRDLYRVASSVSSESDSFFRLTPTCLVVSLEVYSLIVLVFALPPDSLMMSGACLKSGSNVRVLSGLIFPNSEHTVQRQTTFHV